MSTPIRLGIIGAGGAVRALHLPVLRKMRQIRIAGVASRSAEKAAELAAEVPGVRVYSDYQRLLSDPDVDAVLTAVPIEYNGRVLIDCVQAGKHVIAEKPIAATAEEGAAVMCVCARTPRTVLIAENFRYRLDLAKARQILESNLIGEPFAFQLLVRFDLDAQVRRVWTEREWRRNAVHPGGFLLDAGVHAVSFLRDLLGGVSEVYAHTLDRHPEIKDPDTLMMQVRLESGVTGQYFACYTAKVRRETLLDMTVYGSRGTLEISPGRVEWNRGPDAVSVSRVPKSDRGYRRQWQNFCDAINGHAPVVSTPQKAFDDLLVIDAALRSAREGRSERPNIASPKFAEPAGKETSRI